MRELRLFNLKEKRQPMRGEGKTEPDSAPSIQGQEERQSINLEQRSSEYKRKIFPHKDG